MTNKFATDIGEKMTDHEGNVWSDGPTEENIQPREYGTVDLVDVPIGARVRLLDKGRGPYDEQGDPVIDRGAVARHEYYAVLNGFEDIMVDDGLYEKHARVITDTNNGRSRLVPVTELGPSAINEQGKRVGMASFDDCYYYATGAFVIWH
jgi:hypothetical protein